MLSDPSADHLYKDLYLRDEAPLHPGEILRDDILPAVRMTRKALAAWLGISPRTLGRLLTQQTPVTLDLALRLGGAFGHGPRYWLGLQMQYDCWCLTQPCSLAIQPIERSKSPVALPTPPKAKAATGRRALSLTAKAL